MFRLRICDIHILADDTKRLAIAAGSKYPVLHYDTVFTPRGIRYETHRTSQARQMKFSHDGNDADDANDAEIDITQLFKWDISQTASSASLASQRSRKESKHGRSVATGQPAEKPTGTAPNPCEAAGA